MDYCKKIIILNNLNKENSKITLCLEQIGTSLNGEVKFFNFKPEFDLMLGVMLGGFMLSPIQLKKYHNLEKGFRFALNGKLDLSSEIIAIVAGREDGKTIPIFYGSNSGRSDKKFDGLLSKIGGSSGVGLSVQKTIPVTLAMDEEIKPIIESQVEPPKAELYETDTTKIEKQFDVEAENNQAEALTETLVDDKADIPKETLYKNDVCELPNAEETEFIFPEENYIEKEEFVFEDKEPNPPSFFNLVSGDLETMFLTYPEEKAFAGVFPNSKFVHVDYSPNGLFYCLGVIYGTGEPAEIVYAVPASKNAPIPKEVVGTAKWLPLPYTTKAGKTYDGFYVMYQSARTGEVV